MKKRKAIILGTGFLLMVVAYVAWCWRPFYLRPAFVYENDVPPGAKTAVQQWLKDRPSYSEPFPFTLKNSMYRLQRPWLVKRNVRIFVSSDTDSGVIMEEEFSLPNKGNYHLQFEFTEMDGKWRYQPSMFTP